MFILAFVSSCRWKKLWRYIVGFSVWMEGLRYLIKIKVTCKVAKSWYLLVHLVVEMISISQLECLTLRLRRLFKQYKSLLLIHPRSLWSYLPNLFSGMQVCYVAFWDEITVKAQELVERRIGENGFIGNWRVVVVRDLPFADQRLNGKIPKVVNLWSLVSSFLCHLLCLCSSA